MLLNCGVGEDSWESLGLPVHHQLPESTQPMSIELAMPSNHLILCPLLLLPSIFPTVRVFSSESVSDVRIMWPKYRSFSFSISPSNEYSGLISFRIDGFDLLAVQGTLKSLLQYHSSKASILHHSAGLKLNIQETKIMASSPITSWQIDGETMEKVTGLSFLGLQNHCRWQLQPWN